MRILGVDPGLSITGYGVIEATDGEAHLIEAGVIRTSAQESLPQRLKTIYTGIREIIHTHRPSTMVIEELYTTVRHPRGVIAMSHVRGVVALASGEAGLAFAGYLPTRIKKALTGQGHASKEQVQRMVAVRLRLKTVPRPDDVSDALALALAHTQIIRSPFQKSGVVG